MLAGGFAGLSFGWWSASTTGTTGAQPARPRPGHRARARWPSPPRGASAPACAGWLARRQGWLFFPLLTLEGLNLHVASSAICSGARGAVRALELALVVLPARRLRRGAAAPLPPGKAVAFLGVQMAVFGVCLGGSFAPNHKGMPLVPATTKLDFLRRQVLMSRNVRGSRFVDFAMGGLNYQIEHHLFPSMPRPNLGARSPLVRAYCERAGRRLHRGRPARVVRPGRPLPQRRRPGYCYLWSCPFVQEYRA